MKNESSNLSEPENQKRYSLTQYLLAIILILLIIFLFYLLIFQIAGTWNSKITAYFAITAIYGFEIKLLNKMPAFKGESGIIKDIVSRNIFLYSNNTLHIAGFIALVFAERMLRLSYEMSPNHKVSPKQSFPKSILVLSFELIVLGFSTIFEVLSVVFALLFSISYVLFHLFVVSPLSYPSMFVASTIVDKLAQPHRLEIKIGSNSRIRDLLGKDLEEAKAYALAIPSVLFSVGSAVTAPFL